MNLATLASLRQRFLLALLGVLLLALLALVLVARYQVMPILLEDEETFASSELDRVERALGGELNHMRRLVEDWAHWDDTYDFVRGERPEYVDSNLYEATLETLELQTMLFLDNQNAAYWVVGYDEAGQFRSCPGALSSCGWAAPAVSFLDAYIRSGVEPVSHTWLLVLPNLAMAALSPIYQSREEAPSAGWLAMVRPLSEPWVDQLRNTTGIDLTLAGVPSTGPHKELVRLSPMQMQASRYVPALPPSRAVRIEAVLPRQRYQVTLETFRFALYWTSGVLIVTLLLVLWLLEHIVLSPLRQLSRFTQRLQHDQAETMPSSFLARRDEIGTLAREFRHLWRHQRQQSAQLLTLTQRDPLTGIANRRLFDERFATLLGRQPAPGEVAVMMIDIDHFKRYNDHYGHPAGDACLIELAKCMDQQLSQHGFLLARTGGEEFSALLPDTPLDAARQHAAALLTAIEALALPHAASLTGACVTVSIGVASRVPETLDDIGEIMRAADQALYQAKNSGRNRVCLFHEVADQAV